MGILDYMDTDPEKTGTQMPPVQMEDVPAAAPFNVEAGNTQFQVDPSTLAMLDRGKVEAMDVEEAKKIIQAGDFVFNKVPKAQVAAQDDPSIMDRLGAWAKGVWDDEEQMTKLALAFNTMRLEPDQALAAGLMKRLDKFQGLKSVNKTVQSLRAIGTPEAIKYADLMEANPSMAKEIYKQYLEKSGRGSLTYSKEQMGEMNTLRDDLRKDLELFSDVEDGYRRIRKLYENPSDVSDYALAVSFAKILDPGSVAREGEVKAVQNSGAITKSVKQSLINAINGEGALPPEMRNNIARLADKFYMEQVKKAETTVGRYESTAKKSGIALEDILMRERPTSNFEKINIKPVGMTPPKGTPMDKFNALSDDEKKKFLRLSPEKQAAFPWGN